MFCPARPVIAPEIRNSLSLILLLIGWAGSTTPAPAQSPDEPQLESDSLCLTFASCSDGVNEKTFSPVQESEDFDRLAAQLLRNPVAPAHVWEHLLYLQQGKKISEQQVSLYYRSQQWQERRSDATTSRDLDLLSWFDLWRRHNPEEPEAWSRWAYEAARTRGEAAVIAELESALAADPGNAAVRSCLLNILHRFGSTTRLQELLDAETEPDPEVNKRYSHLPEELRSRFAFEISAYKSEEALVEILEQARRKRPDDPFLEVKSLQLEARIANKSRASEILTRLLELSDADHSVVERAVLCYAIGYMEDDAAEERCWKSFSDQIVQDGLHLSPSHKPEDIGKLDYSGWHLLVFRARERLVQEAVLSHDLATVEELLIEGPGFGYGELWELALDLSEVTDEEGDAARELEALHNSLCSRLGRAVGDGSLERPVLRPLATCPKRAGTLSNLLDDCDLDAEKTLFDQLVSSRISDISNQHLGSFDAPIEARIDEIDRRLNNTPNLSVKDRDHLERALTNLLIERRDAERLIDLGKRLLARKGFLDQPMRKWLKKVRKHVRRAETEVLAELLPIRPDDRLLRLRIAYERLLQTDPDLSQASRLAKEVLSSSLATVRERAEANYFLGRVAVIEGRLEDATPLLAEFYETRIDHEACPAVLMGCDRDYPLHLISIGDWPRLEAYQQLRARKMAQQREELMREKGLDTSRFSAMVLEKMTHRILHPDMVLDSIFLEEGCGLPSALRHLKALALKRPDDPAIQSRLARESKRACIRRDGPFPWSSKLQPTAANFAYRQPFYLLSAHYP